MVKAVRIHANGGPEVMCWEEIALPPPGAGEARVRHTAIGINYSDTQCAPRRLLPGASVALPGRPWQRSRRRGRERRRRGHRRGDRRSRRLCRHARRVLRTDRCLCAGTQRSGGAPDQASRRHIRPASGGDVGERVHRIVDHQPNSPGRSRANRSWSILRLAASAPSCANGRSISARPWSAPPARTRRRRSRRSTAAITCCFTGRSISSPR